MLSYLDPATGSMVISIVVAGFAGVAVAGRSVWAKVAFWRKDQPAPHDTEIDIEVDADSAELDLGEIDDSELGID